MTNEILKFILIILLFIPLWFVLRSSGFVKNKKYKFILFGFLALHLLGLILSSSNLGRIPIASGVLSVFLSVTGLFITYSIWWLKKKRRTILDFLKLTWTGIFTYTYLISWNNFQTNSSWTVGQYFAGIFHHIGPDYLIYLQIAHFMLLAFIALLQYRNQKIK